MIRRCADFGKRHGLALLLVCALPLCAHAEAPHRHVLLLHSYHQGMSWVDKISAGFSAALERSHPGAILSIEYMDAKRAVGEEHLQDLRRLYGHKFKGMKFDVVVLADDTALRFVLAYYDELFPGTPVVFCGINNFEPGMLKGRPQFTGILEDISVEETLAVALALHPGTRQVYIVNDTTETGQGLHRAIAKAIRPFEQRVGFTFLENYTVEELAGIIAKLPHDSIILRSAFFLDKAGKALPTEREAADALDLHATVPVYGLWDTYLGLGIVGGKLDSGMAQGEAAAQLAGRILDGTPPGAIPVTIESPNRYIFDYRQMQRFGLSRGDLPAGSTIINAPQPFYSVNKAAFWLATGFTALTTIALVVLYLNIRRRKRLEMNLRQAEAKFRQLFNCAGDMIYILDPEGRMLEVNQAACERMGYSRPEFLTLSISRIAAPEYAPLVPGRLETIRRDGRALFETAHVTRDGRMVPVEVSSRLIEYAGVSAILSVARDISDRKKAEEDLHIQARMLEQEIAEHQLTEAALREREQRLAVTLRSIGDGVITTDVEGRVVMINKVAEQLCGWTQEEAVGQPFDDVFRIINEKSRLAMESPVARVLATGVALELANHTVLVSRDGSERVIADSAAPILSDDEMVMGTVLVFRDMTEKKMIEEELFKARKLESIGILAGGIAHDFNNYLTAILGSISLVRMLVKPEERPYSILLDAEKASERAKDLTQQLLTFSRGGAPVRRLSSIGQIIRDTTGFALRGSNVRCEYAIADGLRPVEVDTGQMSQVIDNLVINADQAMPSGGLIRISADNEDIDPSSAVSIPVGEYVRITVEDQGVGIPEANLGRIFDPYFTTKQQGNGLGLATVYSIVKNHDGFIKVNSRPGVGTAFTLYLPAALHDGQGPDVCREGWRQGQGRILVMDDEEIICQVVAKMLEVIGYEATTCRDGLEACALYGQARAAGRAFDAVIMDITVPGGVGGKEAIVKLREIDPQVRAIVSSGYANDPIMAQCRDYGFDGILSKPYNIEAIGTLLKSLLAER